MTEPNGVLVLEDGSEWTGRLIGGPLRYEADRGYGEVVFNTSMTGYQEILTDPSYFGQMVVMTYPHIGNTGVNAHDVESAFPRCAGLLVRELSDRPSHWQAQEPIEKYLIRHGIPAMTGLDTRALTVRLRKSGVIRGLLVQMQDRSSAKSLFQKLPSFEGRDLIREVTTKTPYPWKGDVGSATPKRFRVAAMDFGIKWNLLRELERTGCTVTVYPATATAANLLETNPDGIFLSNGPGDPAAATYAIQTIRDLLGKKPIFGVCMGHQLLALALGGRTYKLKFGHRGGNQPVLDQTTGKIEISSHNHGYAVDAASLPSEARVTHLNLNDRTVEGLAASQLRAFSVQYHPEACPGPHDASHLFRRFVEMMESHDL